MKTFTARDLNEKRSQIKQTIKEDGRCTINYCNLDRKVDFQVVMVEKSVYEELQEFYESRNIL